MNVLATVVQLYTKRAREQKRIKFSISNGQKQIIMMHQYNQKNYNSKLLFKLAYEKYQVDQT